MILTEDEIKKLDHIPDVEVAQDIHDTEMEIKDYSDELEILMRRNLSENRVRIYFLEGNIIKRTHFCNKLKEILEYRKQRGGVLGKS